VADHPHAKTLTTIAGFVVLGLILLAATFGMGEWRSTPPDTAQVPTPPVTVTR
jgi:hypothetical protein